MSPHSQIRGKPILFHTVRCRLATHLPPLALCPSATAAAAPVHAPPRRRKAPTVTTATRTGARGRRPTQANKSRTRGRPQNKPRAIKETGEGKGTSLCGTSLLGAIARVAPKPPWLGFDQIGEETADQPSLLLPPSTPLVPRLRALARRVSELIGGHYEEEQKLRRSVWCREQRCGVEMWHT